MRVTNAGALAFPHGEETSPSPTMDFSFVVPMTDVRRRLLVMPAILPLVAAGTLGVVASVIPREWFMVLVAGALALVPAVVALLNRRLDVFEPVHLFAGSYAVLFVGRPIYDLTSAGGIPIYVGLDASGSYFPAQLVAALGMLAFYIGYYLSSGKRIANAVAIPRVELSKRTLAVLTTIGVVLAFSLFCIYAATSGGIESLGLLLTGRRIAPSPLWSSTGYLYAAPLWLSSFGILLLAVSPRWVSPEGFAAFAILFGSQVVAIGSGTRSWFLVAGGSVVILWYLRRNRRPGTAAIAIALPVIFALGITLPVDYRVPTQSQQSIAEKVQYVLLNPQRNVQVFFSSGDTAMLDDLALEIQAVPDLVPYEFGLTFVQDLTRPIPRPLWPDKPHEEDVQLTQAIWPTLAPYTTFTFSVFGEPYLNFSYFGALILALFGVISKSLYVWFREGADTPAVQAIFAVSLPFMVVYMRGGIGTDYHRHLIFLAPMLIAIIASRHASSSTSPVVVPVQRLERQPISFPR